MSDRLEYEAGEVSQSDKLVEENLGLLQGHFQGLGEWRGVPITKENYEDLFDVWVSEQDLFDLTKIVYPESNE